jgi:transposase-like protein
MRKRQSTAFKLNVVENALRRGTTETVEQVAKRHGIGHSTLTRWMAEVKQGRLTRQNASLPKEKRPQDWTPAEKFQALVDTAGLNQPDQGRYCRQHGLFEQHLTQWKQECMATRDNERDEKLKASIRALKHENKRLQRELNRKEKALAEAAALMVLKKKAQAMFGMDEDS